MKEWTEWMWIWMISITAVRNDMYKNDGWKKEFRIGRTMNGCDEFNAWISINVCNMARTFDEKMRAERRWSIEFGILHSISQHLQISCQIFDIHKHRILAHVQIITIH